MPWQITDHVCRVCLGRVLFDPARNISRCADCGLEGEGGHESVCVCGVNFSSGNSAGLRCIRNPSIGPDAPQEIMVERVVAAPATFLVATTSPIDRRAVCQD
jgi:hypothetical protein